MKTQRGFERSNSTKYVEMSSNESVFARQKNSTCHLHSNKNMNVIFYIVMKMTFIVLVREDVVMK